MKVEIFYNGNTNSDELECIKHFSMLNDIKVYSTVDEISYSKYRNLLIKFDNNEFESFDDYYAFINDNGLGLL